VFLTIAPDGTALPLPYGAHAPRTGIPQREDRDVRSIWYDSEGFNRYRGTGWMKEPCASCEDKEKDLGGCRCQAYMLAHDAETADPVPHRAPTHHLGWWKRCAAPRRARAWSSRWCTAARRSP